MQTNALPIIARKWNIKLKWLESKCFRMNAQLDLLKQIGRRAETTFTFGHLMVPHPPFVFDADGRCLSDDEAGRRTVQTNFLAQLAYTNARILEIVDALIRESEIPPIIILQGDEGPFPRDVVEASQRGEKFDWRGQPTDSDWRQKMGILNALYLPGAKHVKFYPEMSPVNTFRIVFNNYFGRDYDLLADLSYGYSGENRAYDFFDITEKFRKVFIITS